MTNFTLTPHASIPRAPGPVLVCILDGWGVNKEDEYNAIFSSDTPCTDALRAVPKRYRTVRAHGKAVGLPSDADMGNSEVGHNALGSGQVIDQGARLVDIALETGKMFTGDGFKYITPAFADHTVHLIGLLSDGGVHSRYDQLIGTIKGLVSHGAKRIRVHILTDGRDVPDGSSVQFTQNLEQDLKDICGPAGVDGKIASGGGRMYVTMDRYEVGFPQQQPGPHPRHPTSRYSSTSSTWRQPLESWQGSSGWSVTWSAVTGQAKGLAPQSPAGTRSRVACSSSRRSARHQCCLVCRRTQQNGSGGPGCYCICLVVDSCGICSSSWDRHPPCVAAGQCACLCSGRVAVPSGRQLGWAAGRPHQLLLQGMGAG
jgi:hypothetical protein